MVCVCVRTSVFHMPHSERLRAHSHTQTAKNFAGIVLLVRLWCIVSYQLARYCRIECDTETLRRVSSLAGDRFQGLAATPPNDTLNWNRCANVKRSAPSFHTRASPRSVNHRRERLINYQGRLAAYQQSSLEDCFERKT